MDDDVTGLERKVFAGEVLTAAELEQLDRAARKADGPRLKVTVAHALINANKCREAWMMLEPLAERHPRDAQIPLAQARAYSGVEAYRKAESFLHKALKLQPDDPEALRALAVLAMRKGERAKARTFLESALELDPLDGEARSLLATLDEEDAAPPIEAREVILLKDFTQALVDRLKRGATPHLLQRDAVVVRLAKGGVARLDLKSLYQGFLDSGQSLKTSLEAIAAELTERALEPTNRDAFLATILPVLRDVSFLDRAVGAAHREGPAGLFVFYAPVDQQLIRYAPVGALESLGLSLQEVDDAAWRNLDAVPAEPLSMILDGDGLRLSREVTGLWALAKGDGHDAARLLREGQQTTLIGQVGPQPWRIYLGLRELVLIASEGQPWAEALEKLEPAADGIRGIYRLEHGRLTQLPESTAWRDV